MAADIEADEVEAMAEVDAEVQPLVTNPFMEEADGLSQTEVEFHGDKEWEIVKSILSCLGLVTVGSILLCVSCCTKGTGKIVVILLGCLLTLIGLASAGKAFMITTGREIPHMPGYVY